MTKLAALYAMKGVQICIGNATFTPQTRQYETITYKFAF